MASTSPSQAPGSPVLLFVVILFGVVIAGWYWAGSGHHIQDSPETRRSGGDRTPLLPRADPSPPVPVPIPAMTVPGAGPQIGRGDATLVTPQPPTISSQNATTPPSTGAIRPNSKAATPEEIAAVPPPPEAVAAMKAGPPPDVLRGMQNPPQHMIQGMKMTPPEFKHALNPPGRSPPAPSAAK